MSANFTDIDDDTIHKFVSQYPLAWIVPDAAPHTAMLMPVLFQPGAALQVFGHLPKRSEATQVLKDRPGATLLFLGPNAYVPTQWIRKSDWAPTWNFVSLSISTDLVFDEAITNMSVEALSSHMESGSGWDPRQLGARYDKLLSQIIGFTGEPSRVTPRFKLGQDETAATQADLRHHLKDHPISDWMPE